MGGERKRKREKREYARRHYGGKKDKAMEKKREKMERYHMGKEDVRVAATTLAPSSSSDASPSFPSFAPSHEVEDVGDVPRHTVGVCLHAINSDWIFIFIIHYRFLSL